jgi:hypothetical protein
MKLKKHLLVAPPWNRIGPKSPYPHVARKVKKGQKWLKNGQKGVPEKWGLDVFKVP